MTMTDPKQDVQDVRAQFEAWVKDERGYTEWGISNLRLENSYRFDSDLYLPWMAYTAAMQSPAVRELVEAGNDWCDLMPGLAGGPEFDRLVAALRTLGAGHE